MPTPIAFPSSDASQPDLDRLSPAQLVELARANRLGRHRLAAWASRNPDRVPLVNGELPWIALGLADLD